MVMNQTNRKVRKLFFANIAMIVVPAVIVFIIIIFLIYNLSAEKNIDRVTFEANDTTAHRLVLADKVFFDVDRQMEEIQKSMAVQNLFATKELYEDMTAFRNMVTEFYGTADKLLAASSMGAFIATYAAQSDYVLQCSLDEEKQYVEELSDAVRADKAYRMYRRDIINGIEYLIVTEGIWDNETFLGTVVYGLYYDDLMSFLDAKQANLLGLKLTDELGYTVIDTLPSDTEGKRFVKTEKTNEKSYILVCYTDISDELKITNIFSPSVALLVLVIFILLIVLTAVACLKIYVPFERVMNIMNEEDAISRIDEYERIIGNNIRGNARHVFRARRLDKSLENMNKMQMVALQSQINPHFISNTLQIIGLYAERLGKDGEKVAEMLVKLSTILRFSFSTKTHTVALNEEIEYLKMYVDIQKERLFDSFDCVIEIPENMMSIKVPKVTFQPIVENAVRCCQPVDGRVYIKGYMDGGNAYFEITNDGKPIEKKLAEELNKKFLNHEFTEDVNIGLNNVNQRLHLIYGDGYGLKIGYDEEGRTKIQVKISVD
ncbi:MAG: hypothetical protein E7412_00100 [Ruminococcaceae bacterium]|nr:hypothetical protein [Oscillospiraceae bacterium]